jgi:hypothetical protein
MSNEEIKSYVHYVLKEIGTRKNIPPEWLGRIVLTFSLYIMELTTNGVVITDAIKYVQGKMDHLNKTEKALLQDIKEKEDQSNEPSETQEDKETPNGVF